MTLKKITPFLLLALVLTLVAAGFNWQTAHPEPVPGAVLAEPPADLPAQVAANSGTITVTGVGQVSTPADMATITLGVRTLGETAEEALNENSQQVQSVLQALRDEGIASADIETSSIQLYPQYDRTGETQDITGFEASNIVTATIRDIDALGGILDAAVSAGSNTIQNIQFQANQAEDLVAQARELAVENARDKAEQLAGLFEVDLGAVTRIDETSSSPVTPTARQVEFAEDASVPVQPGSQSITVQVLVSWRIIPSSDPVSGSEAEDVYPIIQIHPVSGPAGSEVTLMATGFPANTAVEIGIGRWRSEYEVVQTTATDSQGRIEVEVTIPAFAEVTEQWVVVVTTQSGTKLTEASNVFLVTNP